MTLEKEEGRIARWRNHPHGSKEIGWSWVGERAAQEEKRQQEFREVGQRQRDGGRRMANDSYLVGQIRENNCSF